MTDRWLLLRVHLHDARYHGAPEWPPSPARLFQALVAGGAARLAEPEVREALTWLEAAPAPIIVAPRQTAGQRMVLYVPNNDLDAKEGDPARIPELRVAKQVAPRLLLGDDPILFAWPAGNAETEATTLIDLADRLYQLGRGVDMAWATGSVVDHDVLEDVLNAHPGEVHRPTPGARGQGLLCPRPGTFASLVRRHKAQGERFRAEGTGRQARVQFAQAPRGVFREVVFGGDRLHRLFELRQVDDPSAFAAAPLTGAHGLVVALRDAAFARLRPALPDATALEAVLVGRRQGEPERVPQRHRARIVPLPSIGHEHTDPSIRRVLVEIPLGGPIAGADLEWAFSGLVVDGRIMVDAEDRAMLRHYARPSRRFTTVTPVALPVARRRIEPRSAQQNEAKDAPEREREEQAAVAAVRQALRHAGIRSRPVAIEVQREPWSGRGERAEAFAAGPRFAKERLWHVAMTFADPLEGPLVLGNGRFLGLGVLRPVDARSGVRIWRIVHGLTDEAEPEGVARALRRAVMARAQTAWGDRALPWWVTGHRKDGTPATGHDHLAFVFDGPRRRLLVVDPRALRDARLEAALEGLTELRAGRAGLLSLEGTTANEVDPLLTPARRWRTVTPYRVRRHGNQGSAEACLAEDVRRACDANRLPVPMDVEITGAWSVPGVGLEGHMTLSFDVAVAGPLLLGRSRHQGGGLFEGAVG